MNLAWTDDSASETGFLLQRATNASFIAGLVNFTIGPNIVTYNDNTAVAGTTYYYRCKLPTWSET